MKKTNVLRSLRGAVLTGALAALPVHASAQDGGGAPEPEEPKEEKDLIRPEDILPGPSALQKEMLELFHRVERNLESITDKLADAGAGQAPLEKVEDSGIAELLRSARSQSDQVVGDIERILQIAEQMGGTSMGSSSSGGEPKSQGGESPLDQERDTGPRRREDTPEGPRDHQGEDPQGSQTDQDPHGGDKPKNPTANPPGGENREGSPDEQPEGGAVPRVDDKDRWGFLPDRVRDTFRNQGGDDLPVQYRDWIDAYYRRLNRGR